MSNVIRFVLQTIGVICLLVGIASIVMLLKIGGESGASGVVLYYVGVFGGIGGWVAVQVALPAKKK
jgi:hypothetical protein